MAKTRVHELAKELDVSSKDIIQFLEEKNVEVKNHMSNIEDDAVNLVRNKFGKKNDMTESAKAEEKIKKDAAPAAKEGENGATKNGERPKKKSTISAVFNPQNSKNMGNRRGYHSQNGRAEDRNGRPINKDNNNNGTAGAKNNERTKRPEGERPVSRRLNGERPVSARLMGGQRPVSARLNGTAGNNENNNNSEEKRNNNQRDQRQNDYRNNNGNNRNNNRNDRNDRNDNRNNDRNDNRNDRNERFNRNDNRGDNRNNNRDNRNDNRNNQNRDNRNDNRNNNNRDRFNNNNKQSAMSAAPAEDVASGKQSRDKNKNNNRNNQNNRKDYDKLGGKKQENYINLEKHGGKKKRPQPQPKKEEEDVIRTITLPEYITIKDLSDKMKVQASALIKKLFLKGQMVTLNQEVNYETAEEIALEFNCIAEPEEKIDVIAELLKEEEEDESKMVSRPPVVCVMGHVDHGKTSLLDAIRDAHVTDREAGGITQHIGAYMVSINNQKITFLDTPGHEAFTAMRMRGANSTDIAILVVAADDGVMPQTVEAINHAKAAGVEIIVAVNKIDKPNANIDRVKQELSEYELIPEDWGGSTIFVPVSAHTHEGIDQLLEMILLTAEVMELKANPKRNARGVVVEAQLDKGRGAVATVLVQKGTLKVGQPMACGSAYGKVRAMIDENGRRLKEAGPSTPVEILGLNSVPDAGETFVICDSEKEAHNFADTYIMQDKEKLLEETRARMSLDDLFSRIQAGNVKELDIIVKADVQGSVEAVKQSLEKLSNEEVVVKVIHGGVGAINESDIILASASQAIIIGFNVRPDPQAKATAEHEGVDVRLYKVIYNAIEDVEAAMKGMLDPVFEEKVLGHAEIRQIFKASGIGNIAGSYVLDGTFERGCKVRITREGEQIFEGELASLKRFKDDVKEVKAGYECGLVFEGFNEIAELDQVEAYKMVEVQR